MRPRFLEAEVALEWWRASGPKTADRLASLVNHQLEIRAVTDQSTRDAIHADALAGRHPWEG